MPKSGSQALSASAPAEKTLVLVGGGHAHVQVLRRFAMDPPADVRLLVVLDRSVAVYSGMVPGFVAGEYTADDLEIDVLPLARRAGAGVLLTAATDLDPVRREIALEGRPPIRYDLASIDVGSTVRGLDLPGVREHALATRPIGRFVADVFERLAPLASLGRPPRIAIVGGGAAGCEIAFGLDVRLREEGIVPDISIVTSDDQLLAGAAARTKRLLEKEALARKIRGHFGQRVVRVEATAVITCAADEEAPSAERKEIPADLIVWATGAAPVAFPRHAGVGHLPVDPTGFIEVRGTLQTVGFDDVFAVGDCARLVDARWVPRAGVYAVRQGPILEKNLRAALRGKSLTKYRPQRDFLSLLNLGGHRALGSKWGFAFAGTAVYRLKDRIDRRFMDLFQVLDGAGEVRPSNATLGAMGGDGDDEEEMACGGCAAKLGASPLAAALAALPPPPADATVVLGLEARDDVAATRTGAAGGATMLHNIDVIRSFCDDPFLVGRVAASNALSDLHAKGGRPQHAQAVIGLPDLDSAAAQELLFQTLSGIRTTLDELGVSLLGGHTTIGDVLTVGLSVTGEGPDEHTLLRQSGALPGDLLLLTQPLGTGVILAADMQGRARGAWVSAAHGVMQHTNDRAGRIALEHGVHAATDVTGFGFAGHLRTLLDDDGLVARIERGKIPLLPGARLLWESGLRSTAHPHNLEAFGSSVSGATDFDAAWLFDPQTAGGLLFAVTSGEEGAIHEALAAAGEPAAIAIGRIAAGKPNAAGARGRIEVID